MTSGLFAVKMITLVAMFIFVPEAMLGPYLLVRVVLPSSPSRGADAELWYRRYAMLGIVLALPTLAALWVSAGGPRYRQTLDVLVLDHPVWHAVVMSVAAVHAMAVLWFALCALVSNSRLPKEASALTTT